MVEVKRMVPFDSYQRHACTRCRTTDVEGTHGQLGTRLTDRLRCHHTDCFAGVDQQAAAQVAAVALGAQAVAGVASQRGTDFHFVDAQRSISSPCLRPAACRLRTGFPGFQD
jgi:hypothetical protein